VYVGVGGFASSTDTLIFWNDASDSDDDVFGVFV
jgi:hypothetical protein